MFEIKEKETRNMRKSKDGMFEGGLELGKKEGNEVIIFYLKK